MKTISKQEIMRRVGKPIENKIGQPCGPTGACTICKSSKRSTLLKLQTEKILKQ